MRVSNGKFDPTVGLSIACFNASCSRPVEAEGQGPGSSRLSPWGPTQHVATVGHPNLHVPAARRSIEQDFSIVQGHNDGASCPSCLPIRGSHLHVAASGESKNLVSTSTINVAVLPNCKSLDFIGSDNTYEKSGHSQVGTVSLVHGNFNVHG